MFRQAVLAITPILLTAIPHSEESEREGRILGFSNPFGFYGHEACVSDLLIGKEHRVGECYNEIECVAGGGIIGGYCGAAVAGTVSYLYLIIFVKLQSCLRLRTWS